MQKTCVTATQHRGRVARAHRGGFLNAVSPAYALRIRSRDAAEMHAGFPCMSVLLATMISNGNDPNHFSSLSDNTVSHVKKGSPRSLSLSQNVPRTIC